MRTSAFCLILLATACAPSGPPGGFRGPPGGGMERGLMLFVSPAGEPFRGTPGAEGPMAAWFAGADADRDGSLSFAEFQADFRRWFAALDTDHDREIAPAEVTRYETEILPEMASRAGPGMGGMGPPRGGRGGGGMGPPPGGGRGGGPPGGMRRGGGGRGPGGGMGGGMAQGAARFGLLPIPHPIMSADEDLNRGISPAEFDRAAVTRFNLLDEARDGRLTLAELAARRLRGFEGRRGGRRTP